MSGGGSPIRCRVLAGITALCLVTGQGSGSAAAQDDLPDYDTCIAVAVARFERDLSLSRNRAAEANFEIVSRDEFEYCGTLAVVTCDRSEAPLVCQSELADAQAELLEMVLSEVPDPAEVRGLDPIWSDGLYPQLHAVAHGTSAGPDCAGADEVYERWCVTHRASSKVSEAVMLWQVARVLGVARDAVDAGWAEAPPPPTPVQRPQR